MIADWEAAHVDATKACNVGAALVVQSTMVRGALTALSWLVADESPRVHVASLGEGVEWCCKKLETGGIALGAPLARAREKGIEPSLAF